MKRFVLFFLTVMLSLLTFAASPIETGDKVPDFSALDENGDTWTLSEQRATYLVVYFYPAAFTGGCTRQACAYRDHNDEFARLGASVVGVSGDEYGNLEKFKSHHNLNFTLLSDPDGEIAESFGVPTREGSTFETDIDGQTLQLNHGVTASRWTFVIDTNGKLIYKDSEVSAATDPEAVLQFIATHDERKSCTPR